MTAPSPQLARAARLMADGQGRRIAAAVAVEPDYIATVTTVTAGGASDGNALVKVTYRNVESVVAGYLSPYTPAVGHRVLVAVVDSQPIVLGRVIGHP